MTMNSTEGAGVQNIVTIVIIVTIKHMRRGLAERNSTF